MHFSAISVLSALLVLTPPQGDGHRKSATGMDGARVFPANAVIWQPGPASLPPGAQIAVLEGDPCKEGPFVFRVKLPDGYRVPPHTHPRTERVTVLSGIFHLGMGDAFDRNATQAMSAGSYGYWPAGMKHFVWAEGETVLQFHGTGPWSIEYLNPLDDPRNQKSAVPAQQPPPAGEGVSQELSRLFKEDQGDREHQPIDWAVVSQRDRQRLARVKELCRAEKLQTGADYYHAAMVLQHGGEPADYLLGHELCVAAIAKGESRAKWLAAASEDRYLMNLGRPQRFGTQYKSDGPNQPLRLYPVEPGMTDALRKEFNVPTLDEAKAREALMNK